ncbi:MFS transporter [Pseudonocardia cypriaca]|uniref:Putative MFS family arabinose efflux permease n=1 Tax=Pseudonocardia cypriaca TaxID=882449 RepID=A0A543GG00_9PSEU|nr:MFS transporter [Pseudonocardia cypriaca]TQM44995.1 putative MFS family arabinose efflux permease [Pseudonocardia cypriaca]
MSNTRPAATLVVMCACAALVVGFVASVNLALPLLADALAPSSSALLWVVDGYVLVFACLVIPGGAAGDRFGRKGVLTAGLATVALGALVSALAPTIPVLLAGRVVAGIGAAAVLPNTLGCLLHATPPERRPAAIGWWAAATGVGGIIGNVGGGALLAAGGWRSLFAGVVPIAVALAVAVAATTPVSPRTARPLRPVATLMLTGGTFALLLGIIEAPELGWAGPVVIGGFVLAVGLYAAWARAELRAERPLLDPRLFRIPLLRSSCLGMVVCFFGMFGLFFVNASFLQYGKGYGVLATGLGLVPLVVPLLAGARFAPWISARLAPAVQLAAAFALIGGGLVGLSTVGRATPYPIYAAGLVVIGTGCALALPRLSADIAGSLPPEQAGVSGGLQSTTRELGSALGVAVIGTVLTGAFVAGLPPVLAGGTTVPHTVAAALAIAPDAATRSAVLDAFVAAVDTGFFAIGLTTLVTGALVTAQSVASARARRSPERVLYRG